MIAPFLALALGTTDLDYRLLPGDTWTVERTLHYHGGKLELDMTQVESIVYVVSGAKDSLALTGYWKLKETRMDGNVIPAPKDLIPISKTLPLKGETKIVDVTAPADIARYRTERMLGWGRTEPEFWPAPELARIVGVKGEPKFMGTDKDGLASYSVDRAEVSGDWPMKSHGDFTVHTATGIVVNGKWTIQNAPMPGGEDVYDLDVSVKTLVFKLAPRRT